MQEQYNHIVSTLRRIRDKQISLNAIAAIAVATAFGVGTFTLLSIIELFAWAPPSIRSLFAALVALAIVMPLVRRRRDIGPLFNANQRMSIRSMALVAGQHFRDIGDRLSNSLQLFEQAQVSTSGGGLALAQFDIVAQQAKQLPFDELIDANVVKRPLIALLISLVAFAGSFAIPGFSDAVYRNVAFASTFVPPAPFALEISVEPGTSVAKGSTVELVVAVTGDADVVADVKLFVGDDHGADEYTLRRNSEGLFSLTVPTVRSSFSATAKVPWYIDSVQSNTVYVEVLDQPEIRSISGTISPPAYTRIGIQPIPDGTSDLKVLPGSSIALQVAASKPIRNAWVRMMKEELVVEDSLRVLRLDTAMLTGEIGGSSFGVEFQVLANCTFQVVVEDEDGRTNANPVTYSVQLVRDSYPVLTLVEPRRDVDLKIDAILPVFAVIGDDFGFSKLVIKHRLTKSASGDSQEEFSEVRIPLPSAGKLHEIPYEWDLNSIGIQPSNTYEMYVEVFDNDVISGPKSARSAMFTVRLPSLEEIFKKADDTQQEASEDLEKLAERSEELRENMEELKRELRAKKPEEQVTWDEKKKLEEMIKEQEEISEKLNEVREKMQEMTEQLKENNAMSQETLEKYQELQELMQQVDSPELRNNMRKMQQAMQNMDQQEMQKQMEKMEFNEEQFLKSIERTRKILQRLQAEQKADEIAKRSEELQRKQEEMQKRAENTSADNKSEREQLAKDQQELSKEFEQMKEQAEQLQKLMEEIGEKEPAETIEKAMQEMEKQDPSQQMQQASENMQKGDMQQAQKQQKKAQQSMKNFSQQMQQMKQQMQQAGQQENIRRMQQSLEQMLGLSEKQEQMNKRSSLMDYNSNEFQDMAKQQGNALEDLQNVARDLTELSERSMSITPEMGKEMGRTMNQMQQAIQQSAERNSGRVSKAQQKAMESLNATIKQMQQALGQMQGEGEGEGEGEGQGQGKGQGQGFAQGMQQMIQQQMALNQAMQQMMQQGGQNGMSEQQRAQMKRLGKQQGSMAGSMQEMAEEQRENKDGERILGSLEQIAKDMKEVAQQVQSGNVNEETLQRQERILNRMLDAARSTYSREFEEKRQSRQGSNDALSGDALEALKAMDESRAYQELLRSIREGYSADYEALIRAYFEALSNKNQQ